jgi:hypothetical protein
MSFQAYLDTAKAQTGKPPADFAKLAAKRELTKHGEHVVWLKADADAALLALRRAYEAA